MYLLLINCILENNSSNNKPIDRLVIIHASWLLLNQLLNKPEIRTTSLVDQRFQTKLAKTIAIRSVSTHSWSNSHSADISAARIHRNPELTIEVFWDGLGNPHGMGWRMSPGQPLLATMVEARVDSKEVCVYLIPDPCPGKCHPIEAQLPSPINTPPHSMISLVKKRRELKMQGNNVLVLRLHHVH